MKRFAAFGAAFVAAVSISGMRAGPAGALPEAPVVGQAASVVCVVLAGAPIAYCVPSPFH